MVNFEVGCSRFRDVPKNHFVTAEADIDIALCETLALFCIGKKSTPVDYGFLLDRQQLIDANSSRIIIGISITTVTKLF